MIWIIAGVSLAALVIGAAIGVPLGMKANEKKESPTTAATAATVAAGQRTLNSFADARGRFLNL